MILLLPELFYDLIERDFIIGFCATGLWSGAKLHSLINILIISNVNATFLWLDKTQSTMENATYDGAFKEVSLLHPQYFVNFVLPLWMYALSLC